jgi:hypothetical protein
MNCSQAITMMMNGRSPEVARIPSDIPGEDSCLRLAVACARAIVGESDGARKILRDTALKLDDTMSTALFQTCLGYLALDVGDLDEFTMRMREAISDNSRVPLPWYSLGLHCLWRERDFKASRAYLSRAVGLVPDSSAVKTAFLSLEVEEGNLTRARELLRDRQVQGALKRPKIAILQTLLVLASTPGGGGVLALCLTGALFIPVIGLPLLVLLLAFSSLAFFSMKRHAPRLAVLPAVYAIAWVAGFFVRVLIEGKAFP